MDFVNGVIITLNALSQPVAKIYIHKVNVKIWDIHVCGTAIIANNYLVMLLQMKMIAHFTIITMLIIVSSNIIVNGTLLIDNVKKYHHKHYLMIIAT